MTAPHDPSRPLRGALLVILLGACVATLTELWLLEHYEDAWQYAPLLLLGAAILAGVAFALRPTRATLLGLRGVMVACFGSGLVGLVLHYRGNAEFELEIYPHLSGFELFAESMRGATPVLAPAGMMFIGLIGLVLAWRHPAGRS